MSRNTPEPLTSEQCICGDAYYTVCGDTYYTLGAHRDCPIHGLRPGARPSNPSRGWEDVYRAQTAEIERLRAALLAIQAFGHGNGHGRGFTCANMARDALSVTTNEGTS